VATTGAGSADRDPTLAAMSAICNSSVVVGRNFLIGALLATALVTAAPPPAAAGNATLQAAYYISIAGFTIGGADVDGRFSDTSYTAAIKGSTRGLIRLVSDSQATLTGSGRISGTKVVPAAYTLATSEGGFETHVDMAMRGGSIVTVHAEPSLIDAPDRVPVTANHKRRVVDPVGAFVIALGDSTRIDGAHVCNRTVPVFDGWQRYDVRLFYKDTKAVEGHGDSYSGNVIVCGARYVPIAGHRRDRESVQHMADNKRLEVWLVPIENTGLLLPYRLVIGTEIGDLVISARKFVVSAAERHASAN
jgi:hypothetical protein